MSPLEILIAGCVIAAALGLFVYRRAAQQAKELRTRLAASDAELVRTRALFDAVFEAVPTSLIVLDADYRVVRANRAAERAHGVRLAEHLCHEILVGSSERCVSCPATTSFATGLPARLTGEHTDPRTGEILAIESHRLDVPGQTLVLLSERSVAEQRKLEARLLHQEKMAAFGLLAAGIAHDLGNPLNSIGLQLQLLRDDQLTPEVRSVIATVRSESERLGRILRELVAFARRRRDEAAFISVQSVVADALRLLRHDHRMRDVKTSERYDSEAPPVFLIEDHLMQVVFNLLINALDAMAGRGTLRIEVKGSQEGVALRIHDTGLGMDRAVLERCFEPLYTTKNPGKGTGLGLSISRDIVTAAGGSIELHSAPGQGTTAVVLLPGAREIRPRVESAASKERAAS